MDKILRDPQASASSSPSVNTTFSENSTGSAAAKRIPNIECSNVEIQDGLAITTVIAKTTCRKCQHEASKNSFALFIDSELQTAEGKWKCAACEEITYALYSLTELEPKVAVQVRSMETSGVKLRKPLDKDLPFHQRTWKSFPSLSKNDFSEFNQSSKLVVETTKNITIPRRPLLLSVDREASLPPRNGCCYCIRRFFNRLF